MHHGGKPILDYAPVRPMTRRRLLMLGLGVGAGSIGIAIGGMYLFSARPVPLSGVPVIPSGGWQTSGSGVTGPATSPTTLEADGTD